MEQQTLINIYNTLLMVETKGESTVYMGACLSTLKDLISKVQEAPAKDNE